MEQTNMNTQHTPGPWKVEADPVWKGQHPLHDCRFITSGPHSIADEDNGAFMHDPNCQIIARMTDCEEQRANASLIAACPDLLSACEEVMAWAKTSGDHGGNPYLMRFVIRAEAAIAKATGGAK